MEDVPTPLLESDPDIVRINTKAPPVPFGNYQLKESPDQKMFLNDWFLRVDREGHLEPVLVVEGEQYTVERFHKTFELVPPPLPQMTPSNLQKAVIHLRDHLRDVPGTRGVSLRKDLRLLQSFLDVWQGQIGKGKPVLPPQELPRNAMVVYLDGDQWCAVREGFINLQESPAGFGATVEGAMLALVSSEIDSNKE